MFDKYIIVQGIQVRYRDIGAGSVPIVLIHGLLASLEYWDYNLVELSKQHRVIALDLIGFGKTDKPIIDYTPSQLVQFLKNFLDALSISRCHLIGHSLGGGIALNFAIHFPSQINQLILVSSAGLSRSLPWTLRLLTLPFWRSSRFDLPENQKAAILRSHAYDPKRISDDFIEKVLPICFSKENQSTLLAILRSHANIFGVRQEVVKPVWSQIVFLRPKTLIIWGKQDHLMSLEKALPMIAKIPQHELYVIDHCGHFPQIEYPQAFNKKVLSFLKG